MGNILLKNLGSKRPNNGLNAIIDQVRRAGPSDAMLESMLKNDITAPNGLKLRDLYDTVRNMTPEDAFRQYGGNFDDFRKFKW